MAIDLLQDYTGKNIAEKLDQTDLDSIAITVVEDYSTDNKSRTEWLDRIEDWTKLALQITEDKTYPWPKASNVKYPLLTIAAIQFNARAFPALVPNEYPVTGRVLGEDPQGQLTPIAEAIGKHMSYQLLEEMEEWIEDMDKLTTIVPIIGCVFKKTYYDSVKQRNCSELILPRNLVINYWAKTLETAPRITHELFKSKNEITERINLGLYLEPDGELPQTSEYHPLKDEQDKTESTKPPVNDSSTPFLVLEQHRSLDLDKDGYEEPYIVTVLHQTRKVLRIVPRFLPENITLNGKNKIAKIDPINFFTKFGFSPNPDGSIYDIGFGLLLGAINDAVNTLINQLIDAGTLSNLQTGFIGKGIRIKGGDYRFRPGEWKVVNASVDDLKKGIFPLQFKDPSNVLFQLLGMLVESGFKVASTAEIFVGKMPGQNTPATTTQETVEQGMKLFTAIYKRIYKALEKEYKKLFKLNTIYLPEQVNTPFPISTDIYKQVGMSVKPSADPDSATDSQKLQKLSALQPLIAMGVINIQEYALRYAKALGHTDLQKLLIQPQPPGPTPDKQLDAMVREKEMQNERDMMVVEAMLDAQKEMMGGEMDAEMKEREMQLKQAEADQKMRQKDREFQQKQQQDFAKMQMDRVKMGEKMQMDRIKGQQDIQANAIQNQMAIRQGEEKHQVALQQGDEKHKVAIKQAKEMKKAKPTSGKSK
jgi:chaperonin GroES